MNNLRNLRKEKGLSQADLHRITGIPLRTIEDWEAERSQIASYHRMRRISGVLGCSIEDLMMKSERCLYGDSEASVLLFQEEDGVHITVYLDDEDGDIGLEPAAFAVMPRKEALQLLKHLKKDLQIKDIIKPYIKHK